MAIQKAEAQFIQPILRAAEVLRAFGPDGAALRVRDVAQRTGLHKATASRLLRTLAAAGLVERVKPAGFRSLTNLTPRRKLLIGYASQNEQAEFPAQITAHLRRAAERHGAEVLVFDNRFHAPTALRNIAGIVDQRADVAIIFTTIASIATHAADQLARAGIPLIAVEMPLPGAPFYGANNYDAGWMAGVALGRFARRQWKSHVERVLLIELPEAGPLPQKRMTGALDGIREILPGFPDFRIVRLNGQNEFSHSQQVVRDWLRSAPPGNCLVAAINDPGALGAIAAFRAVGRAEQCAAVGQNATLAARQELRQPGSPLIGSVAYHPERYGTELIRMALDLSQRRPVAEAVYAKHCFVSRYNVNRLYPGDPPLTALP